MSGVIRALKMLRRGKRLSVEEEQQLDAVITVVEGLLEVMPDGPDASAAFSEAYARIRNADGLTPLARRMRHAARHVEERLEAAHSLTLSTDIASVDEATWIMRRVVERIGNSSLHVVRGDSLGPHKHGAFIRAQFPHGAMLELDLRRAHEDYDDVPPGNWIMEGGAWPRSTERRPGGNAVRTAMNVPMVDEVLGVSLPADIEDLIVNQVQAFLRACTVRLASIASAG